MFCSELVPACIYLIYTTNVIETGALLDQQMNNIHKISDLYSMCRVYVTTLVISKQLTMQMQLTRSKYTSGSAYSQNIFP